jgi:hypothetical protein
MLIGDLGVLGDVAKSQPHFQASISASWHTPTYSQVIDSLLAFFPIIYAYTVLILDILEFSSFNVCFVAHANLFTGSRPARSIEACRLQIYLKAANI